MVDDKILNIGNVASTHYPLVLRDSNQLVVRIKQHGGVEYGPGFRVPWFRGRRAAKRFWKELALQYPHKDCQAPGWYLSSHPKGA